MKKNSDIKAAVDKAKKLKALQVKATDKLNKITADAAGKTPRKKASRTAVKKKPAGKSKAKTAVKKGSFWQRLFGKKPQKVKSKAGKAGRKR